MVQSLQQVSTQIVGHLTSSAYWYWSIKVVLAFDWNCSMRASMAVFWSVGGNDMLKVKLIYSIDLHKVYLKMTSNFFNWFWTEKPLNKLKSTLVCDRADCVEKLLSDLEPLGSIHISSLKAHGTPKKELFPTRCGASTTHARRDCFAPYLRRPAAHLHLK